MSGEPPVRATRTDPDRISGGIYRVTRANITNVRETSTISPSPPRIRGRSAIRGDGERRVGSPRRTAPAGSCRRPGAVRFEAFYHRCHGPEGRL